MDDIAKKPEKKPKRKRLTKIRLVLTHRGEKLNKEKSLRVLGAIKEHHAHWLGTTRPATITGNCSGDHGYHVGEGVCLLYCFVERKPACRKCRSGEIIKQLNLIFESCKPFAGKGLSAEWQ